jgi:hypothetical protein
MPFAALLIGAILIVVAFNNSYSSLVSELEADIPGFFKWAAAIAAILALGYIPGFRTPSRYLLGLVALVILLTNYQQIYAGITSFASSGGTASTGAGAANPTASYTAANAPAASTTTSAGVAASQVAGVTTALTGAQQLAANPLNPNAYTNLITGFGAAV